MLYFLQDPWWLACISTSLMGLMLTVPQAASELRVSSRFIYRLCKKGLLEHFKLGNRIRITLEAIDDYLETNKKGIQQIESVKPPKRKPPLTVLKFRR